MKLVYAKKGNMKLRYFEKLVINKIFMVFTIYINEFMYELERKTHHFNT